MKTKACALSLAIFASLAAACSDDGTSIPDAPFVPDAPRAPDAPGAPDAATPDAAPQGCTPPTGPGTMHGTNITADETWTAAASPHIVTFGFALRGATLTLEPCAVVRLRAGHSIAVGGTSPGPAAALVARGQATPVRRPVVFERDDPAQPWGSLRALPTGRIDLEHVDLRGGGDHATAQSGGGVLIAVGDGSNEPPSASLRTVDVRIQGADGYGANLQGGATFTPDSTGLVITGAGARPSSSGVVTDFPLFVDWPALASVPVGEYTGNTRDEIAIGNASSIIRDVSIHDRGVPYRLTSSFSMAPLSTAAQGGLLTLTIDAGVTLRFRDGSPSATHGLGLGASNGSLPENLWPVRLVAAGTQARPIVFTSAEAQPRAGSWTGIEWHAGPADGNVMSFVEVRYAGGDSGSRGFGCGQADNDAALIFRNWRPGNAFIVSSTFADSAAGGIVSGWRSDADGPNLKTGNTFTNIANLCDVSRWANANGSCPDDPPVCL